MNASYACEYDRMSLCRYLCMIMYSCTYVYVCVCVCMCMCVCMCTKLTRRTSPDVISLNRVETLQDVCVFVRVLLPLSDVLLSSSLNRQGVVQTCACMRYGE